MIVEGASSFPAPHQLGIMHLFNMDQLSWFAKDIDFCQPILADNPKTTQLVKAGR